MENNVNDTAPINSRFHEMTRIIVNKIIGILWMKSPETTCQKVAPKENTSRDIERRNNMNSIARTLGAQNIQLYIHPFIISQRVTRV